MYKKTCLCLRYRKSTTNNNLLLNVQTNVNLSNVLLAWAGVTFAESEWFIIVIALACGLFLFRGHIGSQ